MYSAAWAVWNRHIFSDEAWAGHPGTHTSQWHYHHPAIGTGSIDRYPRADEHVGYALDGFPIYGLAEAAVLDDCNGHWVDGQYRYQLRRFSARLVNLTRSYCSAGRAANRW